MHSVMDELARLENKLLVLRSQTGEKDAFEQLVSRWQNPLWRHAYGLTGDREAAWDAVQDTWVAVVRGIRRLEDADAFPKWVFTILRNHCTDWVKRRQKSRHLEEELQPDIEGTPSHEVSTAARVDVWTALAGLDERQREMVSLHYTQGFGTREIAEITGIPEGTVKSRLYHAREELRRIMETVDER